MTNEERLLLVGLGDEIIKLNQNRDDMIVAFAAAILDLHRVLIQSAHQTKQDVINRLTAQMHELEIKSPNRMGVACLQSLISTLSDDKLDAAKWLRQSPAGSA